MPYRDFGLLIESERRKRKLSQAELGELLAEREGQSMTAASCRVTISRIEQASGRPSQDRIDALCDILELNNINYDPETSPAASADEYASTMAEITRLCAKLSPVGLRSVLAFVRSIVEYRDHEN